MYGVFGTLASFIIISVFMYLTLGFAMFKMEVSVCAHAAAALPRGKTHNMHSRWRGPGPLGVSTAQVLSSCLQAAIWPWGGLQVGCCCAQWLSGGQQLGGHAWQEAALGQMQAGSCTALCCVRQVVGGTRRSQGGSGRSHT
jgi:hypothetical protein